MAIFKKNEIRQFGIDEIGRRLEDLNKELIILHAKKSTGGALENPGRIKLVKKTIAKLLTLKTEKTNNIDVNKKEKPEVRRSSKGS